MVDVILKSRRSSSLVQLESMINGGGVWVWKLIELELKVVVLGEWWGNDSIDGWKRFV
jgi:hypothetical protein